MSNTELIDRLCGIIKELTELTEAQAEIIGQAEMVCPELRERREKIAAEIHRCLRPPEGD